ncbi:hypothetical protein GCM10011348_33410 [Marinobacterium nitratireducens]|uniref:Uncharacterized protein n=1 Tax=Marinobacterium nitratireducens TaxID=518897 RepID=A0A917ZK22_9GAMM|nr:hypothetical protein [Marinobacterium nitratireducens]GGO85262.1 hypothetical protein GCM10011348_33410 [Marinobacterium nitratireducens]
MSLVSLIKGYIKFGGYLYRHKDTFFIVMFFVFLFIAILVSGVLFFPKSKSDLKWDEFYIDKVIEYPGKNEYRALYGYSFTDDKRVLYRQYHSAGFFQRIVDSRNVDDRKIVIGWAYLSGPWWGLLNEQRMIMEVHYKGDVVVTFKERYDSQYPRAKKVVFVAVFLPIIGSIFVFCAFVIYLVLKRKGYAK